MKKLYFVFDQLPPANAGGLISTYIRLCDLLKCDYQIEIISVFNYPTECESCFKEKKNVLFSRKIDIRFFRKFKMIKTGNFLAFFNGVFDAGYFFLCIPFARSKMKRLISKEDYVVVSSPAAAIFMSKKNDFILEIHSKFENFWKGDFKSKLQVKLMNKPNLMLFRTKADAQKGSAYFPSDYIYNFYDNSEIVLSSKINDQLHKALFIGRLHPDKNPMRLLSIAKKIIEVDANFILDIYGDGELKEEMKNFIVDNGLENNIHLCGFINDKNIYQQYSMLWLTSKTEGFPLTIIEAKANGVPTISTNWGEGVREAITQGEDGYYVNTDDEFVDIVLSISDDKNKMVSLSKQALENFLPFSKEVAKKEWIGYLDSYKAG